MRKDVNMKVPLIAELPRARAPLLQKFVSKFFAGLDIFLSFHPNPSSKRKWGAPKVCKCSDLGYCFYISKQNTTAQQSYLKARVFLDHQTSRRQRQVDDKSFNNHVPRAFPIEMSVSKYPLVWVVRSSSCSP